MYFFYFDESGSRDPSVGSPGSPKDHLYVLLAVGLYERQWHPFEKELSRLKLDLVRTLHRQGEGPFDLADCEVKSNWIRNPKERSQKSRFLDGLENEDRERLVATFFRQVASRHAVVMASVIDKRQLHGHMNHELLHKKAYEFILERIQHYMAEYHAKHQALVVMDDTSRQLNRAVAMKHAYFQRAGNQHVSFDQIVEYPFFTRSELSNGVQLADLLAYNVYRAFRQEDLAYPYFAMLMPNIYRRRRGETLDGLKVWPESSPLVALARLAWERQKQKAPQGGAL